MPAASAPSDQGVSVAELPVREQSLKLETADRLVFLKKNKKQKKTVKNWSGFYIWHFSLTAL